MGLFRIRRRIGGRTAARLLYDFDRETDKRPSRLTLHKLTLENRFFETQRGTRNEITPDRPTNADRPPFGAHRFHFLRWPAADGNGDFSLTIVGAWRANLPRLTFATQTLNAAPIR